MIEMIVNRIGLNAMTSSVAVLLKEKDGDRFLIIWVGSNEASAMQAKLEGVSSHRPTSHDLIHNLIQDLGVKTDYVLVDELRGDTFIGKLVLRCDGMPVCIDARPSDALVLALIAKAPIYAAEQVLHLAGVCVGGVGVGSEDDIGAETKDGTAGELPRVFAEFIENLNLEDMDSKD